MPSGTAVAVSARSTLHLANGDFLNGELRDSAGTPDAGPAGYLRWQGSAFAGPLDFPLSAVSGVSFPAGQHAPAAGPQADGPYCLELEGGDTLFGTLVGLSGQEAQFDAPGLGLLHVQRSSVQRIWHFRGEADPIYLGPNGLLEWKGTASRGWEQDAGRLFTTQNGASLVGELGIPARACVDFELSWTSDPDFTWSLGTGAGPPQQDPAGGVQPAAGPGTTQPDAVFRLEVWDRQLVLLGETAQKADLLPLQKIAPGAGRCHFRIYLDQEHNRAIVFGEDGGLLADLAIADAPAHSGACLRLVNHRGNVRLEQLCILRWNGQPPRELQGGKSRIQRSDGSVVQGEIEKFDAATKEFLIAASDRKSRVPADAVGSIVLSSTGKPPV